MNKDNAMLFPASHSKLSTYETCALKAKFRYILKIPSQKGAAASRGTAIHDSAENFIKHDAPIHPDALHMRPIFEKVREKDYKLELKVALDKTLMAVVPWESPLARFRLVVDALYLELPILYVPEWKSGKVYDEHAAQRKAYAIGGFALYPEVQRIRVTTYYIDQKKKVTLRADRQGRKLLVWALAQRLKVMETDKHFAPRPGRYCFWCDYSKRKGGPCPVG